MPTDLDSYKNGDPESKTVRKGGGATTYGKQEWTKSYDPKTCPNGPTNRDENQAP